MKATIKKCPNPKQRRITFDKNGFAPMLYLEFMSYQDKAKRPMIVLRYTVTPRFFVLRIPVIHEHLGQALVDYINANLPADVLPQTRLN